MRDLVSPMWRTTWDAHGMVGNLTNVYTSRVYGCSPLPALVFTPHFLGTESWGLLVDSHGWITMWSTASRPPSSRRDRDAGPARDLGALSALARGGGAPRARRGAAREPGGARALAGRCGHRSFAAITLFSSRLFGDRSPQSHGRRLRSCPLCQQTPQKQPGYANLQGTIAPPV